LTINSTHLETLSPKPCQLL